MNRNRIIGALAMGVLAIGTGYAQECKLQEYEAYGKPLFSLSRFYNECTAQSCPTKCSGNAVLEYGSKQTSRLWNGGDATFEILEDKDNVYDSATKKYSFSMDDMQLTYENYADADRLTIAVDGSTYGLSTIDGGCDVHLGQLCQKYSDKDGKETLVLTALEDMKLKEMGAAKGKARSLVLAKGSTFTFAVDYASK